MVKMVVGYIADAMTVLAFAGLLIKPVREKVFGIHALSEGVKCLLRSEIVALYYKHLEDHKLREFEFRNLDACYAAYKSLKGNSFIDHLYSEMKNWTIVR